MTKSERLIELGAIGERLGLTTYETAQLVKIERALNRWYTEECNGTIQRTGDDGEGHPERVNGLDRNGPITRYRIPDRERILRKRLADIMSKYPTLYYRVQGDPRGSAVRIIQDGREYTFCA